MESAFARPFGVRLVACLAVFLLVAPQVGFAQVRSAQGRSARRGQGRARAESNPLIGRGQAQYDELRFDEALQTLSAALIRASNSTSEETLVLRLLAFTYLALDREAEAAGAYRRMLATDPDFEPGSEIAPRARAFFVSVRERWEAAGRPGAAPPPEVTLRHRSPAQAEAGEAITLVARLEDPAGRAAEVVLAYRQSGSEVFSRTEAEVVEGQLSITIPAEVVRAPLLEYYFEVLDAQGLPIASRGDVAAPLRVTVPAGDQTPLVEQWWLWTVVGALVVGGAVATYLIVDQTSGSQPGTLIITVE